MKSSKNKSPSRTYVGIVTFLSAAIALPALAACYTQDTVVCKAINTSGCAIPVVGCQNGLASSTCTQTTYAYPARDTDGPGVDRTVAVPYCIYPVSYLDCDNQVKPATCGPTGTYSVLDYQDGQACP